MDNGNSFWTLAMSRVGRIKKWIVPILIVLLALSIAVGMYQTNRLREKLDNAQHNIAALTDTIHEVELKNGELVEWNYSLIVDKNTLRDSLESENLSKKEIERKLNSKIKQLTKIISEFRSDTITMTDTVHVLPDSTFSAPFNYKDDWMYLSGKTLLDLKSMCNETTVDIVSVRVPLTIGLTDDYKVFVHSQNPNTAIVMMNSLSVEPNKYNRRRIGIGLYAGFGMQYGLLHKNIDLGPQVGVGVYWRLF